MSDFQLSTDILRSTLAEMLLYADDEHTMWVLSEFAGRVSARQVVELANHFQPHEHDRDEVVTFLRVLADIIEKGGQ